MSDNVWIRSDRPLSIAHRGFSAVYPENTLEAYRSAIELGVEMIECDVNITSDGKLVMLHDITLDRTTTGRGRVNAARWEEVRQLEASGRFGQEFRSARIPSAEETLVLFNEAGVLSCFEVKGADANESDRIALALVELFVKHNMLDRAFLSSYHHGALHRAKGKCSELLLAPERLPDDAPADPPESLRQALSFGAPVLQHQHTVLTSELVSVLHENQIAVWAWTTNDASSMTSSIQTGADGLMSDDVPMMFEILSYRPSTANNN